ncbi:uncharacterized protein LOC132972712 [Labrus mixtus]|uniref:uncharacterized protein LOC132972712 n=1 Tax=Labrus mixtus TaxID=508554 RepID=UPI0029C0FBBF|nr:uncharacterized protein LOC132972712 [Labrus mixtus]
MRGEPTSAWDSGNNTILEEYTDIAFVAANCLILLITSVVGVAANIFVILAVYHKKSLQTWNNALVVNLAVIDILRCAIDCPLLLTIVITVHQRGRVNELICDAQVASFAFSCCIQLLTLACISAERYQAIAQPFKMSQRRKRIMVLIPLTWTLAILVAGYCLTLVKDSAVHLRCKGLPRGTSSSYDTFGLYMLFPLWATCFAVIIGFYAHIFFLLRSHNRKIFDSGTFRDDQKKQTEKKRIEGETTTVGIVVHGNPVLSQNLGKSVAEIELVSQAEPNPSSKESSAALLASTRASQSIPVSRENKEELKNTLEITDLDTEQPRPSDMQVTAQTEEKPFNIERPNPMDTKAEAKPSRSDAVTDVKSSMTKPQKVSNYLETEKQSKEQMKIDKAAPEMKETLTNLSSPAQVENPKSSSIVPIEQKQHKKSNGGETQSVVTVDQVSSLPPVSINVPETDAAKQNLEMEGAVCMMPSKARKETVNKKKESKMAKRAGYIIISFLLFWLPLITTILVNLIHKHKDTPVSI